MWQCIAQRPRAPPVGVEKSSGRSFSCTRYTSLVCGGMSTVSTNSLYGSVYSGLPPESVNLTTCIENPCGCHGWCAAVSLKIVSSSRAPTDVQRLSDTCGTDVKEAGGVAPSSKMKFLVLLIPGFPTAVSLTVVSVDPGSGGVKRAELSSPSTGSDLMLSVGWLTAGLVRSGSPAAIVNLGFWLLTALIWKCATGTVGTAWNPLFGAWWPPFRW